MATQTFHHLNAKKIFSYDTALSFGPGTDHVSVSHNKKYIYFYTGTPQHPKLTCTYNFDEEIVKDIKNLDNSFSGADYIKGEYIRPAYWGNSL